MLADNGRELMYAHLVVVLVWYGWEIKLGI